MLVTVNEPVPDEVRTNAELVVVLPTKVSGKSYVVRLTERRAAVTVPLGAVLVGDEAEWHALAHSAVSRDHEARRMHLNMLLYG